MIANIFQAFKSKEAILSRPNQILIPDSLKYLWMYTLGILKSIVFSDYSKISPNERYVTSDLKY